jgi:hypothetical protein
VATTGIAVTVLIPGIGLIFGLALAFQFLPWKAGRRAIWPARVVVLLTPLAFWPNQALWLEPDAFIGWFHGQMSTAEMLLAFAS